MRKNCFVTTLALVSLPVYCGPINNSTWDFSGSVVITHQATDEPHIRNETEGSGDIIFSQQADNHSWVVHIEASTTLNTMGVASVLPEANSDAGSAQNDAGKGRLQLSELYYQQQISQHQLLSVGLLDVSGFFEQSRIASDETTQFLGASFTGNPVIEFPDYTLGLVYEHTFTGGPVWRAAVSSSNGIADNSNRSYSQLLSVKEQDKGIFAISSVSWKSEAYLMRLGAWVNTADHSTLDETASNADNYGVYFLAGYTRGNHGLNTRLGLANSKVSKASGFSSVSYQYSYDAYVLGVGAARVYLSSAEPDTLLDDTLQYEVYLRYAMTNAVFLTADIQQIYNSDFGQRAENRDRSNTVYGLRLSYLFG